LRLQHGPSTVRGAEPEVRGQRELQPGAVAMAVYDREHRNRQRTPGPARLLETIRGPPRQPGERAYDPARAMEDAAEIQSRAERRAVSAENHRAQRTIAAYRSRDLDQLVEHGQIDAVELIRTGEG